MSLELSIKERLNLSDVDIVSPDAVIREVVDQLETITDGLVKGVVEKYDGQIQSYTVKGYSSLSVLGAALAGEDQKYDVQQDLGKRGYEHHRFECYLTAPKLPNYKFRMMFFEYGIGGYPVTIVLEQAIASEIYKVSKANPQTGARDRAELEELLNAIFSSNRIISIIQELINATRIAAATNLPEPLNDGEQSN